MKRVMWSGGIVDCFWFSISVLTFPQYSGLITGERKVIIENGKSMIDIDRDVLDVWEEYKRNDETREL